MPVQPAASAAATSPPPLCACAGDERLQLRHCIADHPQHGMWRELDAAAASDTYILKRIVVQLTHERGQLASQVRALQGVRLEPRQVQLSVLCFSSAVLAAAPPLSVQVVLLPAAGGQHHRGCTWSVRPTAAGATCGPELPPCLRACCSAAGGVPGAAGRSFRPQPQLRCSWAGARARSHHPGAADEGRLDCRRPGGGRAEGAGGLRGRPAVAAAAPGLGAL